MRSLFLLVFFSLGVLLNAEARQGIKLSEESEIIIMTMGPYQPELYSVFGHSAIRVVDPARRLDWVYNYGVFDFEQENFFLNFAQGLLIYQLGMADYERFRDYYISQNRFIKEQYLDLTLEERQALFDFLQWNYQPENREYLYNYVYDNCASKIRDVVNDQFSGRISFQDDYKENGLTIRGLMHKYLGEQPWGEWIIDIGLGQQIDREASAWEYMFLPDYIFEAFSSATINSNGDQRPLVKHTEIVFMPVPEEIPPARFTPFNFFVVLFLVVGFMTNRDIKRGRRTRWIDGLLFGFAGFVGLWLAFLWFFTEHLSQNNFDILWAIPFHFVIVFMMRKKAWHGWIKYYFRATSILYALVLLGWALFPEPMNMALVPLVLLMALRAFYISWEIKAPVKE
jgi:hypothetical protein